MAEEKSELKGQECPVCKTKNLTLTEAMREVPYFGEVYIFSMTCTNCRYHKADIESVNQHDPCKYTLEISSENDMKIRVIRSGRATIKLPHITTITPGPASNGYITNVEGILKRVKHGIEIAREGEEDKSVKKKAKNLLKKLNKVMWGQEKLKLIVEDPSGNSAIISDKAVKSKP